MKFLIDLSCPTDVYLFKTLKGELERRGHEVYLTTRAYPGSQMRRLAEYEGLKVEVIGSHGGATLYGKLVAGAERVGLLSKYVKDVVGLKNLKGVVSNANPEICRVGFGFGLKVYTWNDSPDLQVAQTILTSPLSDWIFTPWVVSPKHFTKFGDSNVYMYRSLFPMAWLPDVELNVDILEELGLDSNKPTVMFRESETKSAYLGGGDLAIETVKILAERHPEWQFVARARYALKDLVVKIGFPGWKKNIIIFTEAIDLHSLMAKSDLLISGGGTMMIESAYFGTPVVSMRSKKTYYENFLVGKGLIHRSETVENGLIASEMFMKSIFSKAEHKVSAGKIFRGMKYPLGKIASILEGGE